MGDGRIKLIAVAAFSALAVLGAACGSDGGTGDGDNPPAGMSGTVTISGSSTVQPISSLVAEQFSAANPDVQISVDGPGTSDGFVLFCKGEIDINDASRAIEPEENQACKQNGVSWVELAVGYDGITVMTNPDNSAVTCLSTGRAGRCVRERRGNGRWWQLPRNVGHGDDIGLVDGPADLIARRRAVLGREP